MNKKLFKYVLAVMPTLFVNQLLAYDQTVNADQIIVTDVPTTDVLTIKTDPRNPRQPLPAEDGADYLRSIPGFSIMRKGGSDGEPILRGMAGSRLNIMIDGQNTSSGCAFRMDAPTSYIFPEAYDELIVTKGPQTVLYGPGASAGSVMFNRSIKFLKEPSYKVRASLLGGSFGRHDELIDFKAGNEKFYVQGVGTNSQSGNYEDGNGNEVHSKFHRYSFNGAVGYALDENTSMELSAIHSDGWAYYADRAMDGTQFTRDGYNFRFEKKKISSLIDKLELQAYQNSIDHIMDGYTYRSSGGEPRWARMKHDANGFRMTATLIPLSNIDIKTGLDYQNIDHERGMGAQGVAQSTNKDAEFRQIGVFAEPRYFISTKDRIIGGLRADFWEAKDKRYNSAISAPDTAGQKRDETLKSGFLRYETDLNVLPITAYVGGGYSERFPDYWELITATRDNVSAGDGTGIHSAFNSTKKEKTKQLDIGFIGKINNLNLSSSIFYNQIDDYILIDYRNGYSTGWGSTGSARNINAHTYGLEADAGYKFLDYWKLTASLAYVRGTNETDNLALAQLPPFEGKIGLTWDDKKWFAGGLVRLVNEQNHYSTGQGNIAGKDIGPASGFSTTSIHVGLRPTVNSLISAGVDNLFDKQYAEFISRTGSPTMGTPNGTVASTRVNEPGRMIWLKGTINF